MCLSKGEMTSNAGSLEQKGLPGISADLCSW